MVRRKGYGTRLMRYAEQLAQDCSALTARGFTPICLCCENIVNLPTARIPLRKVDAPRFGNGSGPHGSPSFLMANCVSVSSFTTRSSPADQYRKRWLIRKGSVLRLLPHWLASPDVHRPRPPDLYAMCATVLWTADELALQYNHRAGVRPTTRLSTTPELR